MADRVAGTAQAAGPSADVPMRRIIRTWWPLAASWLLMGLEGPAISAVIARLANPEINLAAYRGVVFPLILFIEAPIIMLLAASTALSTDWNSYRKLRTYMHSLSIGLSLLHVTIAFTPLYDFIVGRAIQAPTEIIEPARIGLMITLPWTWSIAYRRLNQGVLIRFGHSLAVGIGTLVRLCADGLVLAIGYLLGWVPGIIIAATVIVAGVLSEALYVGIRVRPVLRDQLKPAPLQTQPLTLRGFLRFYVPLSLTSLIFLTARPIISASISRMPGALESLAAWPVVTGLTFLLRSFGISYNEVVVALLNRPYSSPNLRRFTAVLSGLTTGALLIVAVTPVAAFWFKAVSGLAPHLVALARTSLWFALPLPALSVLQSWYQGVILHSRRTRSITEAVVIYLMITTAVLWIGVAWGAITGIYVGLVALSAGEFLRSGWLVWRSHPARRAVLTRDTASLLQS
jgi:hypothetical protein